MPVTDGVTTGFCDAEVKPGPVHDHDVALLEFALKITEPVPMHNGPLFEAPVEVGNGLTVTIVVYTVAGLHPVPVLLTVNE